MGGPVGVMEESTRARTRPTPTGVWIGPSRAPPPTWYHPGRHLSLSEPDPHIRSDQSNGSSDTQVQRVLPIRVVVAAVSNVARCSRVARRARRRRNVPSTARLVPGRRVPRAGDDSSRRRCGGRDWLSVRRRTARRRVLREHGAHDELPEQVVRVLRMSYVVVVAGRVLSGEVDDDVGPSRVVGEEP